MLPLRPILLNPMAETSLGETFRRLIRTTGPISLMHYMGESNARYYAGKEVFGARGDFITAPDISQTFGELIGLWLTDIWAKAGRPETVHYVELGPGRGTLAHDALRAMKAHGLCPTIHLVETSAELRVQQSANVPDAIFHDDPSTLPDDGPLLIAGNEFFDALPIRQLVKTGDGWREIMIGLDDGALVPVPGNRPMDEAVPANRRDAEQGYVIEVCSAAAAVMEELAGRLAAQGGAALFADYGYVEPQSGSTFQAVRAHKKVDPFKTPGEADLTAHVDFSALAQMAQSWGAKHLGTAPQGAWLIALGIDQRIAALAKAAPDRAEELKVARDRLVEADQMGALFKIMGIVSPQWPDGAGF